MYSHLLLEIEKRMRILETSHLKAYFYLGEIKYLTESIIVGNWFEKWVV